MSRQQAPCSSPSEEPTSSWSCSVSLAYPPDLDEQREPMANKLVLDEQLCLVSAPMQSLTSRLSASFLLAFGSSAQIAGIVRQSEEYERVACSCSRGARREVIFSFLTFAQ
eukprot:760749-Hanusia_phi.AAC.1